MKNFKYAQNKQVRVPITVNFIKVFVIKKKDIESELRGVSKNLSQVRFKVITYE